MRDGGVGTTHGEERAPVEGNANVCLCLVFEPPAALRDPFNLWGAGKSPWMKAEPLPP
jgi:hypothetical protein